MALAHIIFVCIDADSLDTEQFVGADSILCIMLLCVDTTTLCHLLSFPVQGVAALVEGTPVLSQDQDLKMPFWNRQLYVAPIAILILGRGIKTSKHCEKNVLCHFLSIKTVVFFVFGLVWSGIIMDVHLVKFQPI